MKKEIIKSFDLEAYNKGAKIKTRDGHEVRIICTDAKNPHFPIVALIKLVDCSETTQSYTSKGKTQLTKGAISDNDLVIVEEVEEPEETEFWSDKEEKYAKGYFIDCFSKIEYNSCTRYNQGNYRYFASKEQAKSALAMARISQIMANDIDNFGGVITDEEWEDSGRKYAIYRNGNNISVMVTTFEYHFLAFHTEAQRGLFLEKYRNLVEDYLCLD